MGHNFASLSLRKIKIFSTSANTAYPVPLRSTQIAIATSDNADTLAETFLFFLKLTLTNFGRNQFEFFQRHIAS